MFNKSTRDIVTGNRQTAAGEQTAATDNNRNAPIAGFLAKKVPLWTLCAVAGALLITVIVLIAVLIASIPSPAGTSLPTMQTGQTIATIQADPALTAVVSPGDIVQLRDSGGRDIELLRYVEVWRVYEDGHLLVLVDARQATIITGTELSSSVLLMCHDDPKQAAQMLELQKRIAAPVITLTLQESFIVAPGGAGKLQYTLTVSPEDVSVPDIKWSSSDGMIANVTPNGEVRGYSLGTVTITATCGEVSATCKVTVTSTPEEVIINHTSLDLRVGQEIRMAARPNPDFGTNERVVWASSDPTVAVVDKEGVLKALGSGQTVITATINGTRAECRVTVSNYAESVTFDRTSYFLTIGQIYQMNYTITPSDVPGKPRFSSSNPDVVSVDQNGQLTAISAGSATIICVIDSRVATCDIFVG